MHCALTAYTDATSATEPGRLSPEVILDSLTSEFNEALAFDFAPSADLRTQCLWALEKLDLQRLRSPSERITHIYESINDKLKLNRDALSSFYASAARQKVVLSYTDKQIVRSAFDSNASAKLIGHFQEVGLSPEQSSSLLSHFKPLSRCETVRQFQNECANTINPRTKAQDASLTSKMIESIFAEYFFRAFELEAMHAILDPRDEPYFVDFWDLLHHRVGHLFDRDNALWIARLDQANFDAGGDYPTLRNCAFSLIADGYEAISNHGTLAFSLGSIRRNGKDYSWELAADITLFAEKFVEEYLSKSYFQHEKVKCDTTAYIPRLPSELSRFDVANGGFTYLDCFVIVDDVQDSSNLLLIFQKHKRDETPIPCPSCRSHRVEGNSYPALGVRSWECRNLICPDRSKSNRGKRYSFLSLLKQRAIDDEPSQIPIRLVRKWQRDVVYASLDDTIEMVVRHYSIAGDGVALFNVDLPRDSWSREIRLEQRPVRCEDLFSEFVESAFFNRFVVDRPREIGVDVVERGDASFRVLQADVHDAMQTLQSDSIDGAVTSPPYYNAREYAQWKNIYCYMYDMYNVAKEVFRTLKPGALFLYNIFDYFDNENSITFSAMGKKRIPLSSYAVYSFRMAGFELMGNVVWDKGDIEGKRGFNSGNFSPYYQAPFNCWEHVLIFLKPGDGVVENVSAIPKIIREKPVFKMFGGQNVHGHTAPFPNALPKLLTDTLVPGKIVLDPFAGSLTTGRVAERAGLQSILIERDADYCDLGLRMREEALPRDLFSFNSSKNQNVEDGSIS